MHLDALAKTQSKRDARLALENLPEKLSDTYKGVMKRICSQDVDDVQLAKRVLSWISYALRPLTIKELQYALAIEPGTAASDENALIDEETLISVCAGLVTIDHGSNFVPLVHYTVQEYLSAFRMEELPLKDVDVAVCSLTYLEFDIFTGIAYEFDNTSNWHDFVYKRELEQPRFTYAVDTSTFYVHTNQYTGSFPLYITPSSNHRPS